MGRWDRRPSPAAPSVWSLFQGDGSNCREVVAVATGAKGEAGTGSGRSRGLSLVLFLAASPARARGVLSEGVCRAGRGLGALTSNAPCDEGK